MFQEPAKRTIRQLLSYHKLSIPVYQRGYAWGEEEVDDFIGDLEELWRNSAKNNKQHFLGTMLCYSKNHEVFGPTVEIIDGQQRLTTTSLLLLAFRSGAAAIAESSHAPGQLKAKAEEFIATLSQLLQINLNGELYPKLSLNEKDNLEWARLVGSGAALSPDAYRSAVASVQRLNDAFAFLYERAVQPVLEMKSSADAESALRALQSRLGVVLDDLVVVLLTADAERDVYELFMIINDRGKPLGPLDLIRTSTLSRLKTDKKKFENAKLQFAPLLDVEDEPCRKALVHYINSLAGVRIPKNGLLKAMSKWLNEGEAGSDFQEQLLGRVRNLSTGTAYLLAISEDKRGRGEWEDSDYPFPSDRVGYERQCRLIDALKHESAKPLLVAGSEMLSAARFRAMLGVLERIAMRAFVTGGVHKSTLADFHIQQAKRMRSEAKGWSPQQMWDDALAGDLGSGRVSIALLENCPDEKFIQGVKELRYRGNRSVLAYLLLGIESFDFDEKRPSNEMQFHWAEIHLDHIVPQAADDDPVALAGMLHWVGNLVPLSGKKNAKLKDLAYGKEKAKIYKQSKVMMTRELGMNHETWSPDDVMARTIDLSSKAARVWSLSPRLWDA